MALSPLASVDDLATWLGVTLEGVAAERAGAVLDAASAMVRAEAGQDWDGTEAPADVIALVIRVAANMWANPTGVSQQATGPFSVSYGSALSDADRDLLGKHKPHGGLFTISTTRGCMETDSVYVDVVGSDEPLPVSRSPW